MDLLRRTVKTIVAVMVVWSFSFPPAVAEAGDTLTRIKARGKLRCGVSDGIQGFSLQNADGQWSGMDVDFCRALAAGVLGDPGKVDYVPLTSAARFAALKAGELDVLARNATWTLEREAVLGILFAGVLYYDGQKFLVSASSGVHEFSQLNGATICVIKGTTHEANLAATFSERGQEGMNYDDWWYRRSYLAVPVQNVVGKTLMSFKEFPPRQKPASFTIDQAMQALMNSTPGSK